MSLTYEPSSAPLHIDVCLGRWPHGHPIHTSNTIYYLWWARYPCTGSVFVCLFLQSPRVRLLWTRTFFFTSFLKLPSLELSDANVYGPWIRALLGTASHFCEVVGPHGRPIHTSNSFSYFSWARYPCTGSVFLCSVPQSSRSRLLFSYTVACLLESGCIN